MPEPACGEQEEIIESIHAMVEQIQALHRAGVDAVLKGDIEDMGAIEHELKNALAFKAAHVQSHGCSSRRR